MKNFLFIAAFLASSVTAHMQLSQPLPIRSPLNKDSKGKMDYSYTNPLSTSGSDYPCKGYAQDPFEATANYSPGQSYQIKLAGSATHKGGSCQISLSYDKGKNFHVIHSILGGCPIDKAYKFKVPSDAPKGDALLGWTWFNKVGNREMYMNCAQVTVGGSGKRDVDATEAEDIDDEEAANSTMHVIQADSFQDLPPIFIANVNGPGKCKTVEGTDVNFPKPGPSVEGDVGGKGYKCEGDAPFLGGSSKDSNKPAKTDDTKNDAKADDKANDDKNDAKADDKANDDKNDAKADDKADDMIKDAEDANNENDNDHSILESDTPAPDTTAAPAKKHAKDFGSSSWDKASDNHEDKESGNDNKKWGPPGALICAEDGKSFSRCTGNGPPVHMGAVAAGTACRDGKITWA